MQEWWMELTGVTRFFYGMAAFFSVFFLWQLITAFMGLSGDGVDVIDHSDFDASGVDLPDDVDHADVVESSQAFKILSLRSLVSFFTLFSWGSALYMTYGVNPARAMGISTLWGLAGMLSVALVFYSMAKLAETGTKNVASCKGGTGTVYMDIPAGGYGEIRTMISGALEHVKAKTINGEALPAGTEVRVVEVYGQTLVGVEKI
jgi:membrane protein implicated in regulation of membrane protease activity